MLPAAQQNEATPKAMTEEEYKIAEQWLFDEVHTKTKDSKKLTQEEVWNEVERRANFPL
jgi:hypothetical protein